MSASVALNEEVDIEELLLKAKQNLAAKEAAQNSEQDDFAKLRQVVNKIPKLEAPALPQSKTSEKKSLPPPAPVVNENEEKRRKKEEAKKTAGSAWFDMPKAEMTDELKRDIKLLKMRNALDPKHHYKKADVLTSEYLQTGTIIEGTTEFFSARLAKKDRKKTIADEILDDLESQRFFKRKYSEIQKKKTSGKKAYYKKLQEKRKKF